MSCLPMLDQRVSEFLHQYSIEHLALACDPELADTRSYCEHYHCPLEEAANVLLVASRKGEPKYAACVALATCRLDVNKVVRKKLGVSRISFASPELTRELTGMELGGVTPFGLPEIVPLWVDAEVMAASRIVLGGGNRSSKIDMHPDELLKIPGVEVVQGLANPFPVA